MTDYRISKGLVIQGRLGAVSVEKVGVVRRFPGELLVKCIDEEEPTHAQLQELAHGPVTADGLTAWMGVGPSHRVDVEAIIGRRILARLAVSESSPDTCCGLVCADPRCGRPRSNNDEA